MNYKEYSKKELNIEEIENFSYYSVSRLKTYKSCPQYFYNKYILKYPDYGFTSSTLLGSIAHTTLEVYYKNILNNNEEENKKLLNILLDSFILTLKSENILEESMQEVIKNALSSIASKMEVLYNRSSINYKGRDAIRKRDGSIASNPKLTNDWKDGLISLGISQDIEEINAYFSSLIPKKLNDIDASLLKDLSVVDIYNDLYNIFKSYKDPFKNFNIEGIEVPISKLKINTVINPVLMPEKLGGLENIYINGYIDLLLEKEGRYVIIDHKTGSQPFSKEDIMYNSQLILYSWCIEKLTEKKVSHIGINNINNNSYSVLIPLPNDSIRKKILSTLFSSHIGIKAKHFPKYIPEPYSPCLKMFGKICPFLSICWPDRII